MLGTGVLKSTLVNNGADDRVVFPVSGVSGEFKVRCLKIFLRNTGFFNKHQYEIFMENKVPFLI